MSARRSDLPTWNGCSPRATAYNFSMNNGIDIGVYRARRERLAQAMRAGVAIVPTSAERTRNRDAHYPYRFDSYFYYLTGFREPDAVLAVIAGAKPRHILFCRDKDPEREIWDGFRYGPEAARAAFGFDEAHPITRLDAIAPELIAGHTTLHCHFG